ncbi:hypothetical protein HK104_003273, partial [Borealophlyctis nickersoniae]
MIVKDRKLYCKILEGKNLFPEKARHPDTYCTVSVEGGEERRTPTVFNETDPFFAEELVFDEHLPHDLWRVTLIVYHDVGAGASGGGGSGGGVGSSSTVRGAGALALLAAGTSSTTGARGTSFSGVTGPLVSSLDKKLGRISFPRDWLEDGLLDEEQWFVLMPPDPENCVSGEVRVGVSLQIDSEKRLKTFVVRIYAARNLRASVTGGEKKKTVISSSIDEIGTDPTVETTQRTQCIKDTLNPTYNETLRFQVPQIHPNQELHVSVWDAQHVNAFLGHFSVNVADLEPEGEEDVSTVLPLEHYRPFLNLISSSSFHLAHLFGKISKDREEAALAFIRLMEGTGQTGEFLACLVEREVEETATASTLFRANSMGSKAIDVYMKYLGLPYLRRTIGDIIKHIVVKKVQLELDPTRLDKPDDLKKNKKALLEWMRKLMDAIWDARGTMPSQWRPIFAHLQQQVIQKFPDDPDVRYTAVGGFVFLRFFAPAILGPKLFGIVDEYIDPKTSRTLTLLAKTLQALANLVAFGQKEPYMMELNGFVEENLGRMRAYIDFISEKELVVSNPPTLHHVHFEIARDAGRLFQFFARASSLMLKSMTAQDAPLIRQLIKVLGQLTAETTAADALAENKNVSGSGMKKSKSALVNLRTFSSNFDDAAATKAVLEKTASVASLGTTATVVEHAPVMETVVKVDVPTPVEARVIDGGEPAWGSVGTLSVGSVGTLVESDKDVPAAETPAAPPAPEPSSNSVEQVTAG